jgi:hypothetical protein
VTSAAAGRGGGGARTSLAMSSRPVNCRHVSLSMMFCTTGSAVASGSYRHLFCTRRSSQRLCHSTTKNTHKVLDGALSRHSADQRCVRVRETGERAEGECDPGHFRLVAISGPKS